MREQELGHLGTLGERARAPLSEGVAEELWSREYGKESAERFFLIRKCRFKMEILSVDVRYRTHGRALVPVEHIPLNAPQTPGDVIGMVAYRRVEMREEYFDKDVGRDERVPRDHLLTLEELAEPMQGRNYLIAYGDDEPLPYDEVTFLTAGVTLGTPMVVTMGREVEHRKRDTRIA